MNIFQRLNQVRKAVAYLQKDKQVQGKGYMAITHDAVTAAVREHLIVQGVMVVPTILKSAMVETGTTTSKGIPFMRYEATYRVSFVNCDDPADRVDVEIEAHAIDEGDKAPGKAVSYATKYAFLKLLSIETGDNEEGRENAKPAPAKASESGPHSAPKLAFEMLAEDEQKRLKIIANKMREHLDNGEDVTAYGLVSANKLDADSTAGLWSLFRSDERTKLKKAGEYIKSQRAQEQAA